MEIIKGDDFRRAIKKGLSGGYLFFGDEDYLKLHTLEAARASVCTDEGFGFFNDIKLDPVGFSAAALLDALAPLPMMSDKKIVTVSGLDMLSMKQSELDALYDVLAELKEYDYNVLIISVTNDGFDEGYLPKKPSKSFTALTKHLTPVRFDAVSGIKLISWCQKHFEHNGVSASDDVCRALIARSGSSMFTLASEIDKLSYYLLQNGRNEVSAADVEKISSLTITENAFALTNAVLAGRNEAALEALMVMKYNKVDPTIVLGEISRVITNLILVKSMLSDGKTPFEIAAKLSPLPFKLNEFTTKNHYIPAAKQFGDEKLRRALELCAETDAEIKLSPTGYVPIEKLLCAI